MAYQYEVDIQPQDIDDLLTSAFEGGSNYWISKVEVLDNDWKGCSYASDVISRGGRLFIVDDEGEAFELNLPKLLDGLSAYKTFDINNYDSNDADQVLQLALYGEVVYG